MEWAGDAATAAAEGGIGVVPGGQVYMATAAVLPLWTRFEF